jgi:Transposase, Mutator family
VSRAIVIATGVSARGEREVLGLATGDSEDGAFWSAFLRSLRARGLTRVRLVISDARTGLEEAIGSVRLCAARQRCKIHFLRNVLACIPTGSAEMVLAAIRALGSHLQHAMARTGHLNDQPRNLGLPWHEGHGAICNAPCIRSTVRSGDHDARFRRTKHDAAMVWAWAAAAYLSSRDTSTPALIGSTLPLTWTSPSHSIEAPSPSRADVAAPATT